MISLLQSKHQVVCLSESLCDQVRNKKGQLCADGSRALGRRAWWPGLHVGHGLERPLQKGRSHRGLSAPCREPAGETDGTVQARGWPWCSNCQLILEFSIINSRGSERVLLGRNVGSQRLCGLRWPVCSSGQLTFRAGHGTSSALLAPPPRDLAPAMAVQRGGGHWSLSCFLSLSLS